MNIENAVKVLERIEGTLIADMKSLQVIAEERSQSTSWKERLPGGFNFLLHLTALICCETLGYFISKNSESGRSKDNIEYFILSTYFKESAYKKTNYLNILTSLRTNLAHVFGMTNLNLEHITSDIQLCVGGRKLSEIIQESGIIKINGLKFAELVIDGFEAIKADVNEHNNLTLIEIINKKNG